MSHALTPRAPSPVLRARASEPAGPGSPPPDLPTQNFDLAIIGAGPAGSIAALETARRGRSVLLVDKAPFPRPKVCGCCLSRAAVELINELGLAHILRAAPPLTALKLHAAGRTAHLPWPAGRALSRAALDQHLAAAAIDAGVTFRDATTASLGPLTPHARTITLHDARGQHTVTARIVIVADGLAGRVLRDHAELEPVIDPRARIGVAAIVPGSLSSADHRSEIHMTVGRGGYVGSVTLEDGSTNFAAALDPAVIHARGSLASAVRSIFTDARTTPPDHLLQHAQWKGTPQLTRTRRQLGLERVLIIGDAAGYIEPFTGEGMTWAMASGHAVAPIAAEAAAAKHGSPAILTHWRRAHRHVVRNTTCRTLARLLRHPHLTAAAVHLLSLTPALATPLLRRLHRPLAGCH
jgi:flavin-dependent dehydrogenase